jgi:hypothetical protein
MRLTDPLLNPLVPVAYFGGKPKLPPPVKIPKPKPIIIPPPPPMPKFEMPKPLTAAQIKAMVPAPIPPTPVPPPQTTSPLEATEAADEQRRKQSRRQGVAASIIAGETGTDYQSSATPTGSLLG